MRRIFKYPLEITDVQYVTVPRRAEVLHVAVQEPSIVTGTAGGLMLWALVDLTEPLVSRMVQVIGTGNPIDESDRPVGEHAGTVVDGPLVWHVFISPPY